VSKPDITQSERYKALGWKQGVVTSPKKQRRGYVHIVSHEPLAIALAIVRHSA